MTESTLDLEAAVGAAAERLHTALATNQPCAPIRDLIGERDIELAYAVQQQLNAHRLAAGARVVGRKIGATSQAVQQQLGVDTPDLGVLFDDMEHDAAAPVDISRLLQPKVEGEIAFVLGADLAEGDLELDQVAAAIDHAVVAIEICDSRIANWDISFADTVADNASAGSYVLGSERRTLADGFVPKDAAMTMTVTGQDDSVGTGAASLGDPIVAVQWLARQARALGDPLRAGQVILSGALGPMRPAAPGASVDVTIAGLGSVSITFSSASEENA
ncbi:MULTISPECIES: 2-keto-4-pentenoate hydratase [Pimelobacter]|uniref:2-keto-4-pentenoate hydratase n=1 Tax=Pimelobacter TaxID=2044 RepID=UPI001C03DF73|nr:MULTISPECIES: fumarylacetoacetate hydrolase family protein [Pimelobacter]MBU2694148.1 2-keto-4-pentenoate hydratase [Pimelobacter sp. 30-1]UUW90328.1 fumarylacetoacetate hydrolase family protein [Pimelobacter simplex]UUW94158.1 fumarylacetoacetate hydrolase family protein [Pimelobacter simplex]